MELFFSFWFNNSACNDTDSLQNFVEFTNSHVQNSCGVSVVYQILKNSCAGELLIHGLARETLRESSAHPIYSVRWKIL